MTVEDLRVPGAVPRGRNTTPEPGAPPEESRVAAAAAELVASLTAEPWGQVSVSVYETGRLVSLAPWLTGHAERVRFLLAAQRPDGGWGAPGGYALVPTLAAVEALAAELGRVPGASGTPFADEAAVGGAVRRGLAALRRWAGTEPEAGRGGDPRVPYDLRELPDMPAVELIVPDLLARLNGHLAALEEGEPLPPPRGMNGGKLALVRTGLAAGAAVPQKMLHALEVAAEAASKAPGVVPTPLREGRAAAIGASPAAGAAWLGGPGEDSPVRHYLEAVVDRYAGPVPCAAPVTVFERGWTLSWLRRAGVPVTVPEELTAGLAAAIGPGGVAAGPGLPPDADTTSVGLYTLALLRAPREPDALWAYETETHFCTWQGEEGASPTVNAHVLDAFGEYLRLAGTGGRNARYAAATGKLSAWLRGRQLPDGSWLDRWHVSPYYATACCALALGEYGGAESADAVRGATRWLLDTQREDGSWGRWTGTAEETAYALQTLLLTPAALPATEEAPTEATTGAATGAATGATEGAAEEAVEQERRAAAVERGHRRLLTMVTGFGEPLDRPALWHDKDLYYPAAIVRAAVLGALHLARRHRP
ncbi:prenyltransferase/squalene oxidase repeat-containing protein [Streptosporangium sp. NPDC000239]|uniref:prenyltransferase/squalene oxidase repeat-containing protein n=1 Tax=Streptosporangium sp. NPDC000239 TaxID=3154248 RepID=UPI003322EE01